MPRSWVYRSQLNAIYNKLIDDNKIPAEGNERAHEVLGRILDKARTAATKKYKGQIHRANWALDKYMLRRFDPSAIWPTNMPRPMTEEEKVMTDDQWEVKSDEGTLDVDE
ncbi:hypothetical protein HYALB_00006353 [Hymenoscyphus albidus]|uniref:Uncharacterized protein n=1 Tax=Hymenoscyphus albidus TaxID=595503 RepID=A0A9N9PYU8_9HELO|nr:hypothetical protein HYALB_00006353 [Hymenoscyphus albidus]